MTSRVTRNGELMLSRDDRALGVLIGLAIGDAVGAPVEFQPPAAIAHLRALPALPTDSPCATLLHHASASNRHEAPAGHRSARSRDGSW